MVRGVLLVDTEHGHLQRRVARLDQVTRTRGVGRQPVGNAGDQRVAAGAELEVERGDVQQHLVHRPRGSPTTSDVREGADGSSGGGPAALDLDIELEGGGPPAPDLDDSSTSPPDHGASLYAAGSVARRIRPTAEEEPMAAPRTERLLNLVICLLASRRYVSKEQIRRRRAAVRRLRRRRGLRADVRARQGRPARHGHPRSRPGQQRHPLRRRARLPHPEGRLRAARDHLRLRGAGRPRPRRPHLAARHAGRARPRTAIRKLEAAGARRRPDGARPSSSRGSTPPSPRSARSGARCTTAAASRVRLLARWQRARPPRHLRSLGPGLVARSLVRRRSRPRPRRHPRLPALPDPR